MSPRLSNIVLLSAVCIEFIRFEFFFKLKSLYFAKPVMSYFLSLFFDCLSKLFFFIIHAAKTCCIAFVCYGETPIYQNRDETSLGRSESVVFLTIVSKNMSVHVL